MPTYYSIDETAARRAKEMSSHFGYEPGSATAAYRQEVDKAAAIAEEQKARVDPMYHEKIDRLLDSYARRLAENLNQSYAIAIRCPSVLVAGPANFPVRKKEKQNRADDGNMREWQEIQGMYALGKLDLEAGNASAACRWFEKSAELGNQYAQYQLGKLLLTGEAKDMKRALRWLTVSAEQGNQFAQYALGKLYLLGRDIPQDKDAAVRWFTQAAEQGNEYAQYFLDHMNDPQGPPLLTNATRLLHHMSTIFRDEAPPALPGISFVDSKLRRRIREKKIAMRHKPDDREDQGIAMR